MNTTALDVALPWRQAPSWLRTAGYGYLYWLVFLLVLEPGNVLHAYNMGRMLDLEIEVARIGVAALLGASVSPLLVSLTRRFPLPGPRGWRNAWIHAVGAVVLAFVLIVISCFLAAWILLGDAWPKMDDVLSQLAANWLLLVFAISVFIAISHVAPAQASPSTQPTRVPVKTRGRLSYVEIDSIEWIESQGNYLALHVGSRAHLIRETLASFERRLDPDKFMRIHRRMIVAVDRIREVQPLANGDSTLILRDGRELRASRSYREVLRRRWLGS
ncbi:MAG TPA: LytTR family DNA-binding domain-containing protein [Steroidobacteraceae bacterium]|nr:LytTR family DNA-binding domain-containing protein [Steroidobacteraceae bacterium]